MNEESNLPENDQSEVESSGVNKPAETPAKVSGPESKPVRATEPEPEMDAKTKWIMFASGFLGWYLVTGAIWFAINPKFSGYDGAYGLFINLLCLPANMIALLILAINRSTRRIAFGILVAMALNFFISLALGLTYNGPCFIPFFIKG